MKIHEYQAKELLKEFGVPVPDGGVAFSVDEAAKIAKRLGGKVIVKAQIHAGGRGKGGGVKLANSVDEVKKIAGKILGMRLVTHQTGPEGKIVKKVLVEKVSEIERELYLGIVLDRSASRVTVIGCAEGGMEIETVAAKSPEKIFKIAVEPDAGVAASDIKRLGKDLGLRGPLVDKFVNFVTLLYKAYIENDASLVEINPLVITPSPYPLPQGERVARCPSSPLGGEGRVRGGDILALDAKINLDDNALYRHEGFEAMMDPDEEDPSELEAKKYDLSYIRLNGNIGCMVNGAGLAMATMDIIKLYGGEPADFLDVGGGTTEENVTEAFKIILHDPNVKAILINIFGGIVRCDMIAEGIVATARELDVKVPLVVRLQGTNVDEGRKILAGSNINIISAETLDEAAKKVVEASLR